MHRVLPVLAYLVDSHWHRDKSLARPSNGYMLIGIPTDHVVQDEGCILREPSGFLEEAENEVDDDMQRTLNTG